MKKQLFKLFALVAMLLPLAAIGQTYQSLPYTTGFEDVTDRGLPTGWVTYATGTSSVSTFPCVYHYSGNARNGGVYFEFESSSAQTEIVATCEFADVSSLMFDFYASTTPSAAPTTFEVGVMEDSTFVPVDTITLTTASTFSSSAYHSYRVFFGDYTGTGHRIAMRAQKTSGSYTVMIDDITITTASACQSDPGTPSITTASYSATLTWAPASSSSSYGIYFDSVHTAVYDTTYTITGLNANTEYSGYLYNICPSGDTSEYIPFSFRTECGEITLPYTENFETSLNNMPMCWTRTLAYSSWYTYPYVSTYSYYAHNGSSSLNFYNGPEIATTPRIPCPANEIEVFGYIRTGYDPSQMIIGYVTDPNDDSTFVSADTINVTTSYQLFNVRFDNLTYTDTAYVAFKYIDSDYVSCYLDDITIRQISNCHTPENLTVTANPSGQVSLSWLDTINTAWEVAYGPAGFDPDTVVTNLIYGISTDTTTVTGLADSITYDFYVRGDCSDNHSYWSLSASARPNVHVITANSADTLYACGGTIVDDGGLDGNYAYSQTSYLYVYPSEEGKTVNINGSCTLYSNNYATLTIYEGIGESGRVLGTYTSSTSDISVASTSGPVTIKFYAHGYSDYYAASGFQLVTSCTDLSSCTDPYDLAISNVAGSSAVLSWGYGSTTAPDYFTIIATDTATGNSQSYTVADTVRSYQMTGLSQATNYIVSLQSTCTNGDTSNSLTTSFKTTCLAGGNITVGTGTVSLNSHPINSWYRYSYCQALYRASELTEVRDSIFGIKFFCTTASSGNFDLDIYIDTTSVDSLTAPIAQTGRWYHYNGPLSVGEMEFSFDSAFVRPNDSTNIIITVDNNTGSYYSSSNFAGTGNLWGTTFYGYSDGTNFDPSTAPTTTSIYSTDNRPNIIFMTPCADVSCIAPSVTATASTTSLNVTWAAGNTETAWSVEHKAASDSAWTVDIASTSTTSYVISGLTGNTLYDIRVTSLCGDTTAAATIQMRTNCVAISTLPYTQGFESFTAATSYWGGSEDFEPCWHRSPSYTSWGTTYVYPYLYSTAHTGNYAMAMYGDSYDEFYSYMVMPEMAMDVDSLIVSFWNYASSSWGTYELVVGVMSNPTDTSTFVPVDTISYSNIGAWEYNEVEFRNYADSGRYIAFFCSHNQDGTLLVDDITINHNPDCRRVQTSSIDSITMSTAIVNFTDTNNAGSYTIFWGTTPDVDSVTDSMTVTTNTATLTGLVSPQTYYVWIRTNCTGEQSLMYNAGNFTTVCAVTTINATHSLYEDFEGTAPIYCWTYIDPVSISNAITHSDDDAIDGSQCLRFSSYNYASSYDAYVISPELSADSAMQISFSYRSSSSYSLESFRVGYSTTNTADSSFTWDATITAPSSWNRYEAFIPANTKYVAIHYNTTGCYYYLYVDSLVVELAPTCIKPSDVTVSNITGVSAQVQWTALTPAPAYQVQYKAAGDSTWTTQTSYTDSTVLTGLSNLTNYSVRVRCLCSAGDTSYWSDVTNFMTEICDNPTIAFNYDSTMTTGTTSYVPGYSLYNYSYSEVLVDSAQLAGLTDISAFAFETASSEAGEYFSDCDIYFGLTTDTVLNDWHYDSTYVHVFHGDLSYTTADWQLVPLDTTFTWDGHSNLVVVVNRLDGDWESGSSFAGHNNPGHALYYYNDYTSCDMTNQSSLSSHTSDVTPNYKFINCAEGCAAPVVTSIAYDYESATISWTGTGSSYEINIKETAAANWPATDITVAGNTYTFTGLNSETAYTIRVRQDCSADDMGFSAWTYDGFTTDSLPCMTPSVLTATNVENNNATFAWTSNGNETQWDLHVWYGSLDTTYRVNTNPVTVYGFQAGVTYNAAVRAICGSAQVEGDYSDTITFTTTTCPDVTGLTTSNVTASSVTLNWDANTQAQSWIIEYGQHGFNQGQGTVVNSTTNSYVINGLMSETQYDFYVKAVCGTDWNSENWTSASATTAADQQGIDMVEGVSCTIYPNPTTSATTISVNGVNGMVRISIVDMDGRTVATETLECNADCVKTMDVDNLAQGAYFVRIIGENVNMVKKLIVR